MKSADEQYTGLLSRVLTEGEQHPPSRTGKGMISLKMESNKYDMRDGYPIITSRRIPFVSAMVELEGFIKGITDKSWYQERGCKFWSYWCDPRIVPYGNDKETQALMEAEPELGLIYGSQWRNFHDPHATIDVNYKDLQTTECVSGGVDQFKALVENIRTKNYNRRWKVVAWNPLASDCMALVPCHTDFICTMSGCGNFLDLEFNMRSNDLPLGNPNNVIFYASLLSLLAKEGNMTPRYLKHNITDAHIYDDQIDVAKEHIKRPFQDCKPQFIIKDTFTNIFDWTYDECELVDYRHSGSLKYPFPAI